MNLFGASGHAKVIIDILESQNVKVEGVFDDNPNVKNLLSYCVNTSDIKGPMIISIGDNKVRKLISERLFDLRFGIAIHKSAQLSKYSNIGVGSVMMHGSIVQAGSTIGKHCIINTGATVDHDCIVDDYVHISPQVTLCGGVQVGEGTIIGANSVVLPGVKIGRWCVIGAGSVVSKNLPDFVLAAGNRCEILKKFNSFL